VWKVALWRGGGGWVKGGGKGTSRGDAGRGKRRSVRLPTRAGQKGGLYRRRGTNQTVIVEGARLLEGTKKV